MAWRRCFALAPGRSRRTIPTKRSRRSQEVGLPASSSDSAVIGRSRDGLVSAKL